MKKSRTAVCAAMCAQIIARNAEHIGKRERAANVQILAENLRMA